jgi:phosphoglycolate phosphatase
LKYRLVIFDSDGTLADTLPWMRSVFNDLAEEHGFRKVAPEEYERFQDLHGTALLRALELPLWKLPRVMSGMRKKMAQHQGHLALFNGISEALGRLAGNGIQLAVVSSNSTDNVQRILGPANTALITRFDCGVSMFGKASKIRAVVRRSGVPASEAIYVGDEIRDAEAARKAGVGFGAVTWGQHSPAALQATNPDMLFRSVSDMAEELCGRPDAAAPR